MRSLSEVFKGKKGLGYNQPIELYDIYLPDETLYYTTDNNDINFFDPAGTTKTYTPLGISRGKIETNIDTKIDSVEVKLVNVNRAFSSYVADQEFRGRRIVIRKVFRDALDSVNNAVTIFDGLMDRPEISEYSFKIIAVSRLGTLNLEVPRRTFQLLCNWKFGSAECGADKNSVANKAVGTLDANSTKGFLRDTARSEAISYWRDGILEMTAGTAGNIGIKRKVVAFVSGCVTLDFALPSTPATGDGYTIQRGCDKTLLRCSGDFANQDSYGGFNTIPQSLVIR